MVSIRELSPVILPAPAEKAYFPTIPKSLISKCLAPEVLDRAGDNLVYAMQYGSQVGGDASPNSMFDVIVVVRNVRQFHQRNLELFPGDYSKPHDPGWHTFLNRFGFNFYHTTVCIGVGEKNQKTRNVKVKLAVISKDNFIKGCNGTLAEKEKTHQGAFGFYVAGRVQKAALHPLYKGHGAETMEIEKAINTARVDGVWMALGLSKQDISFREFAINYISLSYRADLRPEKPGKIQIIYERNWRDYQLMLNPILREFEKEGLIRIYRDGTLEVNWSLSEDEVKIRLAKIKVYTALANYFKNPLTAGLGKGIVYSAQKIARSMGL